MGGSGGFGGYTNHDYYNISVTESESSQREIDINRMLEDILKEYNSRDVASIGKHLEEIEKALGRSLDGVEKILFGGSISKSTYIEGLSDVDALVILDKSIYSRANPTELKTAFVEMLRKRFPKTEISVGNLAVTVHFSDYTVQLLPALQKGKKFCIADKKANGWTNPIDVKAFTSKLTAVNENNSDKVVPVIKIVKALYSHLPEEYKLSGYHIEAMAVEMFTSYSGRHTLHDMTQYYLDKAKDMVKEPTHDITGQSGTIDSYFGDYNSISRQKLSQHLKEISERFKNSDSTTIKNELLD